MLQVKEILIQNHDLIKDLEKTEHLLQIQQKMTATLKAEVESNKHISGDEAAKLRKVAAYPHTHPPLPQPALLHAETAYSADLGAAAYRQRECALCGVGA